MSDKFYIDNEEKLELAIAELKSRDLSKPIAVTIKLHKKNRTLAQNRLYWSWVNIIAQEVGHSKEMTHELLREELIKRQYVLGLAGGEVAVKPSASSKNTKEFALYMKDVEEFALDFLGVTLPHPEDYHYALCLNEK